MYLTGSRSQQNQAPLYRADAVMTGDAQLVMGRSASRAFLALQNIGANAMYVEIGSARAVATITSGAVTSVAVTNAGFNFTRPPLVRFVGGGAAGNSSYSGLNQPNGASPSNIAEGYAVLTTGAVSSIVVSNGGSGYVIAPYVFLSNDDLDPYGCAIPSATSGMLLPAGMSSPIAWNGTFCPTDSIAVIGTEDDVLFCGWAE